MKQFGLFHALGIFLCLLSAGCGVQGESSKTTSTTIVADKVVEAKVGTIVFGNYSGVVDSASIGSSSNFYAGGPGSFAVSQVGCESWPDKSSLTCRNAPVQAIVKLIQKNSLGQTTDVDYQYLCSSWSGTPYSKTTITTEEKSWDGKIGSSQQITVLSDEIPKQVFLNPLTNIAYRRSPADYGAGMNEVNTFLRTLFTTTTDYFADPEVSQRAVNAAVAQFPVNNYTKCPGAPSTPLPAKPVVVYSTVPATLAAQGTLQLSANFPAVTWSVVEANGGTIAADGLYTAPATGGTYTIRATNPLNASQNGTFRVQVSGGTTSPPTQSMVSVSPLSPTVAPGGNQPFSAAVSGSSDQRITWSVVEAGGGSITAGGLYTAPAATGTYHIKAASIADPAQFTIITIVVSASSTTTPTQTFPVNLFAANQVWRSAAGFSPPITISIGNLIDTQSYLTNTDKYYSGTIECSIFSNGSFTIIGTAGLSDRIVLYTQNSSLSRSQNVSISAIEINFSGFAGLMITSELSTDLIDSNRFRATVDLMHGTDSAKSNNVIFERIK